MRKSRYFGLLASLAIACGPHQALAQETRSDDWRYDTFHRFRYAAGMEWSLGRFLVLEGYVLRQRDTKSSPTYVNAGAVAIQFYFP